MPKGSVAKEPLMPASVCRPPAVPSVAASSSELPKVFPAVAEVAGVPVPSSSPESWMRSGMLFEVKPWVESPTRESLKSVPSAGVRKESFVSD